MAKGQLLFQPFLQFFNALGTAPLANGSILFEVAGGGTNKNTYTSNAMSSTNANPVLLDAYGRPSASGNPVEIWLDGAYKITVKDSSGNTVRSQDNVTSLNSQFTTTAKSANYTVTLADSYNVIWVDASSGAKTITLPACATAGNGFVIRVKKIDSSSNSVTVDANGSETIEGALTAQLTSQYAAVGLITDGSSWVRLESPITTTFLDNNGNEAQVNSSTASAVNYWNNINGATGNGPTWSATGDDTDVDAQFLVKGAGKYRFKSTTSGPTAMVLYEDADNGTNTTTVSPNSTLAADNVLTLPTDTGTLVNSTRTLTGTGLVTGCGTLAADRNITVTAATSSEQVAGSSNTVAVTPGNQKHHYSAAKAWAIFTVGGGTAVLQSSFNVTSVVRTGTGTFALTWTTGFASASYVVCISTDAVVSRLVSLGAPGINIATANTSFTAADPTFVCVTAFGAQ